MKSLRPRSGSLGFESEIHLVLSFRAERIAFRMAECTEPANRNGASPEAAVHTFTASGNRSVPGTRINSANLPKSCLSCSR